MLDLQVWWRSLNVSNADTREKSRNPFVNFSMNIAVNFCDGLPEQVQIQGVQKAKSCRSSDKDYL